ncbi:MAG TPA: 4Fe-4S dicluster domain-containing protein [Mariniphaga anaerophila]|uniref:4Fe-4S dicluster domain-containing protein n=1 Tax=Mariniphaga anaerophila TaxID=1484053 RepID=A0A831LN68_9BACT|nr:4Fe-4S dicluster domain-containing protein [Mariniphaga anaerophila]
MEEKTKYHALKVDTDKCFGCTHCMKICPTEAIRIENGVAVIDDRRCVDCGNCLRACPVVTHHTEKKSALNKLHKPDRFVIFVKILLTR